MITNQILFLLLLIKASSSANLKITGGDEAVPHSLPYQAGITTDVDNDPSFCSGSLITNKTVITAAHCVLTELSMILITLGAHDIIAQEETQALIFPSSVKIHEDFNYKTLENDIALLYLSKPVTLNEFIQTIEINSDENFPEVGDYGVVSGWGKDSDSMNDIVENLREVILPIISNEECSKTFNNINKTKLCGSGKDGKSACKYDWGAPFQVNGKLVGVASAWTKNACQKGNPTIFTRVSHYADWINTNKK